MCGKNSIKTISNLSTLIKLDVLDLHSNKIEVVEGLDQLRELRFGKMKSDFLSHLLQSSSFSFSLKISFLLFYFLP